MGNGLIGRDDAVATIRSALERGAESLAAVVIEGSAGFGKSALLDHVLSTDDRTVLRMGGELELVRAPLYAVATLTGRHDLLETRDGSDVDTELALKTARAVGALLDLVAEQVADAGPVALVVDDLQWIDRPSVDVLRLAAGRLQAEPCTLVLAGRPAPGRDDIAALVHLLGELDADHVHLGPLPTEDAGRVVTAEAPDASDVDVERCVDAAAGSPLLLRHLARSIGTDGDTAGSPLATATRRMLAGLTDDAQHAVKLAAVGGTEVDVDGVAAVSDERPDDVLAHLAQAADAGLLRHGEPLRFDHDLIRDAVLESIPTTDLAAAHRAWAAWLAGRGEAGVQAAADHLMAIGGQWSDAEIDVVAHAAANTIVTSADRSVELFTALVTQTPPSDPRNVAARSGLAEARLWAGKPPGSDAGTHVDPLTRLRKELATGRASPATLQEAERHVRRQLEGSARDEALARVAKMGAAALHPLPHVIAELEERVDQLSPLAEVWLWRAKADLLMVTGDFVGHEWVGERAHAAAQKLPNDHPARVEAAIAYGRLACQLSDQVEQGLEQLAWAERRAEELGSASLQLAVYIDLGNALHLWGRLGEADARLAAGASLAGDTNARTLAQHFEWRRLTVLIDRGDFALADELLASRAHDRLDLSTLAMATLHLHRGDAPAAVEMLVPIMTGPEVMPEVLRVGLERLTMAAFEADDDPAWRAVVKGACRLEGDTLAIQFSRSLAVAASEGDAELAESIHTTVMDAGPPTYIRDLGSRLAGIAHHRAGDEGRAAEHFESARDIAEASGAAGVATMVDRWLAELGRAPKRPRRARPVSGWDALTDAEMRVVEVVAEGLVYREVAEQLFLSRRTVESHVAAALRKLGLKNRTQLAAAFVERRLEG